MELTIDEVKFKALLKEVLIELVRERRELFYDVLLEAMEDTGLANAIREGRQHEYVAESDITAILEG